jgi:hypothetical protein
MMMAKKAFVTFILLAFCCSVVWGGGRKENESRYADDPAGFTDSIDISEKPPGKWNYYLEAKDKAGNRTLSGPANIYNDPETDLPRATIINPWQNMRVQGNLNIVGIAMDDDGVDFVELTVTRGRDGFGEELAHSRVEGKEYWSYFLDTTDAEIWTDGVYTITVWATDINGLSGLSENFKPKQRKYHQVYWNLDRKKPDTTVTSHEAGALVSGKIRLKGTVSDGNGISSFGYSTDGGKRYIPVKTSLDKRSGAYSWDVDINTKTFDDGPAIIWFQARDGQGTLGTAAHLLFANNTAPDVGIVYPPPDAVVNGIFSIAGYAQHPVGIRSLSWKMGKMGGDFPIIIGNSWWSTEIDIRGEKTSGIEIEIHAEDVSGNVTVTKRKYKVDQNADLPAIALFEPTAGVILDGRDLVVRGLAKDNDGVESVFYAMDSGPVTEIPSSGLFQFVIPDLSEGSHTLDIWAKDITGVTGTKYQTKNIIVPTALPVPAINSFSSGAGKNISVSPFYTGMIIIPESKVTMEYVIRAATVASASVKFGELPAVAVKPSQGKDGVFRANVTVPTNMGNGFTKIELRATDRYGKEALVEEYVFINNTDYHQFRWVKENRSSDGQIVLRDTDEVLLGIGPIWLLNASLRGSGAGNFSVEVDAYGRVNLRALREGNFGPLTVVMEDAESRTSESAAFRIMADLPPVVTLRTSPEGNWVKDTVPIRFNVTSNNRLSAVEYSLDMGGSWTPLLSAAEISSLSAPVNTEVSNTLNVADAEDGSVTILVRAASVTGRDGSASFTVFKDTLAPQAELIIPIEGSRVNGTILMGFAVKEAGGLKSVTYNKPAAPGVPAVSRQVFSIDRWQGDYPPVFLPVIMDSREMPLDENMVFTFEDHAGNSSVVDFWPFVIDNEADIPIVEIVLPFEDEVITGDFAVSGVTFDDDEIAMIYWQLDNGTETAVEAKNSFYIPIALSGLTDNEHSVTVIAEDIYGVKSHPVTRNFRVSLSEPAAAVTFPSFSDVLRDLIVISGTASDRNGIEKVEVSLDNGNSYNVASGTTSWEYRFNTKILKDGPHVVFVRVTDKYEITATYSSLINVDNTPPEITLDNPGDGSVSVGSVSIMGRIEDPNLEEVSIEFRSLEGETVRSDLRSRTLGNASIIKEMLNLAGQRDGLYNIEIVATDKAKNVTRISRNVQLARQSLQNFVEILYPLESENVQGVFNLYGFAGGTDDPGTVTLKVNGIDLLTSDVEKGYYRFSLEPEHFNNSSGEYTVAVYSTFGRDTPVLSREQKIVYSAYGPWVTIDSLNIGDFAYERPYLSGRTGYILTTEEEQQLDDKTVDKEIKDAIRAKIPGTTEISFDNGKTFIKTSTSVKKGVQNYRYRLETGEMYEGVHYILMRSTMKNGDIAVTRVLVQVDKTPPQIRLITPEPGGRYNAEIAYSASATDDVELKELSYHLRIGDKAAYEIPGFLQGLYFEGIIPPFIRQIWNNAPVIPFGGGVTYFDIGMGLSFFEDNVKVQIQYGLMTQKLWEGLGGEGVPRYAGHVLGLKLLAGIYTLQFGPLVGPDWEWLSASFALGANFSLFDLAKEGYTQSGSRTWMSALLLQIEFPKVTLPKREKLRTFSMFTEGQLWFVPTDVNAEANDIKTIIPHIVLGLRLYIF